MEDRSGIPTQGHSPLAGGRPVLPGQYSRHRALPAEPLPLLKSLLNSLLGSGQQQDGCLQRGEWAGRVETRSLKGPASGTDRTGYQNQLCLFLAPLSIWSVGCSGSGGRGGGRSWMGEARLRVCPQLPHLQGQVCPGVTPGKRGRWAAAPGSAGVPGRPALSPPLSPPSA